MNLAKECTLRIKGVAILLLIFHHLFYNSDFVAQREIRFMIFSEFVIQPVAVGARVCVWIFVFLSAYGLAIQYEARKEKETALQFYIRRSLSLIKAFLPAYIIVFLGYWEVRENPMNIYEHSIIKMLMDAFGIADIFGMPMLSAVWWYMGLAQVIVISVPVLVLFCRKFGLGSFLIGFIILQFLPDGIHSNFGGRYLNYLLVMILGVCCTQGALIENVLKKRKKMRNRILEIVGLLIGTIILLTVKIKTSAFDVWQIGGLVTGIAAFFIVVLVSKYFDAKPIDRVLSLLGKYSGNMFMVHAFLYGPCKVLIFWSKNAIISYLTLVVLSLVISIIIEIFKKMIRYDKWSGRLIEIIVDAVHPHKAVEV